MTARTVTTEAVGRRKETPELAMVDVIAIGDGESAAAARTAARDRAATLRESVDAVPSDRIRTVDLTVEDSSEAFDPDTDAAYCAREQLHVECVPETAESVVVDLTDAGGTVRSVEFHHPEAVRRRLRNEALEAAMERARGKAERIAAAEGLAVGEVRTVTTQEVDTGMNGLIDDALSDRIDLHPEPITVSEGVEVVYELVAE
ncbi:MAG: SIMPL domain-containing protein [Haloplanus sp.]